MAAPVSDAFAAYEQELSAHLSAAESAIAAGPASADAAGTLDGADRHLTSASDAAASLRLELSSLSPALRARGAARLDALQAGVSRARGALRDARVGVAGARAGADRAALLDGGAGGGVDKLRAGTERILESRRSIAATEGVAAGILGELAAQRATIARARENLGGVDDGLDASGAVLTAMNRRAFVNRMVIYGIFVFVGGMVVWIVYSKIVRGRA